MTRGDPLVIDANALIVRGIMASAREELSHNLQFTGGIFLALRSLRYILARPEVTIGRMVAFFDHSPPPSRLDLLPGYKAGRENRQEIFPDDEAKEKAFYQVQQCFDMWSEFGVQCLCYKEREADDGVAAAARILLEWGESPIVVTTDRDLFQSVAWGARVWDLKHEQLIDADGFEPAMGVPVRYYLLYKALIGDPSDNIKGAEGVGPARASQILKQALGRRLTLTDPHKQLDGLCEWIKAKKITKTRAFEANVLRDQERLHNVIRGVDLRSSFGATNRLRGKMRDYRPSVDRMRFLKACHGFGFQTVLGSPDYYAGPFEQAAERALRQS